MEPSLDKVIIIGPMAPFIKGNGKIMSSKEMESTFGATAENTKANGKII